MFVIESKHVWGQLCVVLLLENHVEKKNSMDEHTKLTLKVGFVCLVFLIGVDGFMKFVQMEYEVLKCFKSETNEFVNLEIS